MTERGQIRSQRLNHLLKMKLRGAEDIELINHAMIWGVTEPTAKSYLKAVILQAAKTRRINS